MNSSSEMSTPASGSGPLSDGPTPGAAGDGAPRRVFIESFGCQMNDYDVERMVEVLRKGGYERTEEADGADLVIINTCSIREKAENKAASAAGRYKPLKDKNPNLVVAIGGCVAQQEGDALLKRIPVADLTFGPDQIPRIPSHVESILGRIGERSRGRETDWSQPARPAGKYRLRLAKTEVIDVEDYEFLDANPRPGDVQVTALVTIQKGCDNYCSYCVVPNTRGREVSRPADQVVAEVKRFVDAGAREVTLIGQNVNAYHAIGTPDGDDFAELLRRVDAVPGLLRVRFTTSHPHSFTRKVADAFRDLPRLCPWLHLPVQAGSSSVLRRMARDYTREAYLDRIAYLKSVCPDISLSTDIIVGFPGETEAEFEDTLSLLRIVRYDSIYSFSYSRRPGTPAHEMEDDIAPEEKSRRLQAVQALQRDITAERMARMVGRVEDVLIEGLARMGNGQLCGRTGGNHTVNLAPLGEGVDTQALIGTVRRALITQAKVHTLAGQLV